MPDQFPHTVVQCLTAIAQHHGLSISPERIVDDYALRQEEPAGARLLRIAQDIGLKARQDKLSWESLLSQQGVFPLMARLNNGNAVIVVGARADDGDGKVAILDPLEQAAGIMLLTREQFSTRWQGEVVFIKRAHTLTDPNQPFSLRWFIPKS